MKYTIAVVTKLNTEPNGNYYSGIGGDIFDKDGNELQGDDMKPFYDKGYQLAVFAEGEILLLNESGREFGGKCRKPSKWYVEIEEFDTIEEAIGKSKELYNNKYSNL